MLLPDAVGKEIRDRFSGAVEAFSRRQGSGSSPRRYDHARNRSSEDVPSSKNVVIFFSNNFSFFIIHIVIYICIALYLKRCNGDYCFIFSNMILKEDVILLDMEALQEKLSSQTRQVRPASKMRVV